jgi:hypothetical protein
LTLFGAIVKEPHHALRRYHALIGSTRRSDRPPLLDMSGDACDLRRSMPMTIKESRDEPANANAG